MKHSPSPSLSRPLLALAFRAGLGDDAGDIDADSLVEAIVLALALETARGRATDTDAAVAVRELVICSPFTTDGGELTKRGRVLMNALWAFVQQRRPGMTESKGPPLPEFLSVDEAAELLRVNRNTLYTAIERGDVPGAMKIGRLLRVRRSALFEDKP